jgi:hypothetical protein
MGDEVLELLVGSRIGGCHHRGWDDSMGKHQRGSSAVRYGQWLRISTTERPLTHGLTTAQRSQFRHLAVVLKEPHPETFDRTISL